MNIESPAAIRAHACREADALMEALSNARATLHELGAGRELYNAVVHAYSDQQRNDALATLTRLVDGL